MAIETSRHADTQTSMLSTESSVTSPAKATQLPAHRKKQKRIVHFHGETITVNGEDSAVRTCGQGSCLCLLLLKTRLVMLNSVMMLSK